MLIAAARDDKQLLPSCARRVRASAVPRMLRTRRDEQRAAIARHAQLRVCQRAMSAVTIYDALRAYAAPFFCVISLLHAIRCLLLLAPTDKLFQRVIRHMLTPYAIIFAFAAVTRLYAYSLLLPMLMPISLNMACPLSFRHDVIFLLRFSHDACHTACCLPLMLPLIFFSAPLRFSDTLLPRHVCFISRR